MSGGGQSESAGTDSISGVDGPGPADKVISDAVSKDGPTAGNFGHRSADDDKGGPSVAEKKKKQRKSFWNNLSGKKEK